MQYPKLVESKTSANEVTNIEWNPGMDLLATVFSNGALTCSRLLSLQKVWHKQITGRIISIAWRPDGRVLVIGYYNDKTKENICSLHDVENGKKVNSITMEHPITSVNWFQYSPETNNEGNEEIQIKRDLNIGCVDLFTKLQKNSNTITTSTSLSETTFSHQLAHEQTHLNILMISTEEGKISFYALGLFYLGDVMIHGGSEANNSKIIKTHMSACLRYITSVIYTKQSSVNTASSLRVLKLDTFQRRSNEILRVSKMYAKITDELEYLDDTINAITTSWADVLAGLDNKLSSYCSRKNKNPDESQSGYTFLSADELLQLLVIGFPSDNLEKFLADMSDKGLKKLNNAIEQTCLRVQNLIVKNAQKCCYHLHGDLNFLRGMALWRERYAEVGLDDKFIVDAMKSVGSLMLKLTELQQVIDHSLKSTKSFFRWLISIACRMTGEPNNSTVPNDINKTTQQDIQLITDFILENFDYNTNETDIDFSLSRNETNNENNSTTKNVFTNRPTCSNFTLEQVGQYLKNDSLSRLKYSFAKPGSNFWIEFFKSRPELTDLKDPDDDGSSVLLFYPHNQDTSLIQEHKKTCKSIEAAFDSVATNMKFVLNLNENFIHLKDFLRNAPTNRIRVETDIKSMQHYTLFQTKSNQVSKQYLIVESLLDKTFKLICIKFQVPRASMIPSSSRTSPQIQVSKDSTIVISDSGFYENRETKKLLLSFLLVDTTMNDTLIVQVELSKILSDQSIASVDRLPKDIGKIFRTDDSIDKNSSTIIFNLDIYTEPPQERKFTHGMMVKKIKSTVGCDMFLSSGRGVIAFTCGGNKRLHLYELESLAAGGLEIMDDEVECGDKIDESLIDTDLIS